MRSVPVPIAVAFLISTLVEPIVCAAVPGDRPIFTRSAIFSVPFSVDGQGPEAVSVPQVQLYVSGDRGRHWTLYQRQPSTAGRFHFRAGQDGEYWFTVGRQTGTGNGPSSGTRPDVRVIVDTIQPQLELVARVGPSSGVTVRWFVADMNIDPSSLKLLVQEGDDTAPWQPLRATLGPSREEKKAYIGQTVWWPRGRDPSSVPVQWVAIRAVVRDLAGNTATVTRRVDLTAAERAPQPAPTGPAKPPAAPAAQQAPPVPASIPWPGQATDQAAAAYRDSGRAWRPPSARTEPEPRQPASWTTDVARHDPAASGTNVNRDRPSGRTDGGIAGGDRPLTRPPFVRYAAKPEASERGRMFSVSAHAGLPGVAGTPDNTLADRSAESLSATDASDLPTHVCRSRRFQLDYEIDQNVRIAVGSVQLWYTTNRGRSWSLYGEDADKQSPLVVELEREGTYGFRLVLCSADGLAGRPPHSGDPADLWVLADWTPPTARLTSAPYGTGEQLGKLVIHWQADDRQLAEHPVSLAYSKSPAGPWTTIAAGLADTGQYAWQVDDRVPHDFYLRLEVRDQAGNVATDQLRQPISADGLAPHGRIRDVRPLE